ncbi:MAG: PadR family transcriptional regulator [Chloroflexi bacterium]|nr:PadR family transcriptional regulator [Chloroflexota bacterium]
MSLQHLILGVLKYQPLSGYDLNKAFQVSVQHFWDTEQSQIYRALYKMHEQGWVEIERVEQISAPDKKVYRLTDAGWTELRRWLAEPLTFPALHEGWLGQLFFAKELTSAQICTLLEARIADVKVILERYGNEVPPSALEYANLFDAQDEIRYWLLTLNYGIERMRFDLQWAENTLAMFQSNNSDP